MTSLDPRVYQRFKENDRDEVILDSKLDSIWTPSFEVANLNIHEREIFMGLGCFARFNIQKPEVLVFGEFCKGSLAAATAPLR